MQDQSKPCQREAPVKTNILVVEDTACYTVAVEKAGATYPNRRHTYVRQISIMSVQQYHNESLSINIPLVDQD